MLGYFPAPYPDELFYSVVSRYYVHSGFPFYSMALGELMKSPGARVDFEFGLIGLNEAIRQFLEKNYGLEKLVLEHTMFTAYSKFAPDVQRRKAIEVLCTGEGDIRSCLPFPKNKYGKRYMRYCPECAKEDRAKYGETYWHRSHQIRGINACTVHGCILCSTKIELDSKKWRGLSIAEEEAADLVADPASEIEISLAEYATKLLQIELPVNCPKVNEWLVSKLEGTPYITARGKRKYITKLSNDMEEFYAKLKEPAFTKQHQIQKFLMGYNVDFMSVCQMALFLNIPVMEFAMMKMPEQSMTERFNDEVERLYKSGLGCHRIARKVGSCPTTALKANRITEKSERNYAVRKGIKRQDWTKMDKERFPKVKKLCEEIYTGNGGRPKRVTESAVTRAMGWPGKRLDYLPECKEVIQQYSVESIEEYWARECVWAYAVLQEEVALIHWRQLRDMTNMRRGDFERCKKYLNNYTDEITAEKIRELI